MGMAKAAGGRAGRPRRALRDRRAAVLLAALCVVLTGCASSPGSGDPTTSQGEASDRTAASEAPSTKKPSTKDPSTALSYVALGDSYSAAPFVPTTDVAGGCFRSSNNYPALAAQALGATLEDRTCGGARTEDLTRSQRAGVPAQGTALTSDTQLVTLGMGGNDEGVFTTLVGRCTSLRPQDPSGAPCSQAFSTRAGGQDALLASLGRTQDRLSTAVRAIRQVSPKAKVLLVGYPQIISATSRCSALPLASGDYAYAERVNRRLTDAVRGAARATGTTYVDVWRASRGHDICSSTPWINGSVDDQRRAARYHPFAVEQQAVAKLVEAAARG